MVALAIGAGGAAQLAMLGAMGRERGGTEAAWVSLLGSIVGLTLVLTLRALRGDAIELPAPLDRASVQAVVAVVAVLGLALSVRGIDPYFAATGLFGTFYIVGAAVLVPEIGAALFFGAVTASTLSAALALDHFGAFGAEVQEFSVLRVAGVVVLLAGVVLVRAGSEWAAPGE